MQTDQCSGYGTLSYPSDQLQKSFVPPPSPPLPENFSLLPIKAPLPTKKLHEPNKRGNQFGFPSGKELLKDLKKVKLKKIEKSPGGGPVKKPQSTSSDPGGFLAAVLKKRYGRLYDFPDSSLEYGGFLAAVLKKTFGRLYDSPDSSLESGSADSENSFISGTMNCNHKIGQNFKSSVLSQ